MTSRAAAAFLKAIYTAWDHLACWTDTDARGLSEVDEESLTALCDEHEEEYATAEREVMAAIRDHVRTHTSA